LNGKSFSLQTNTALKERCLGIIIQNYNLTQLILEFNLISWWHSVREVHGRVFQNYVRSVYCDRWRAETQ